MASRRARGKALIDDAASHLAQARERIDSMEHLDAGARDFALAMLVQGVLDLAEGLQLRLDAIDASILRAERAAEARK